jgi:hypothetical protein
VGPCRDACACRTGHASTPNWHGSLETADEQPLARCLYCGEDIMSPVKCVQYLEQTGETFSAPDNENSGEAGGTRSVLFWAPAAKTGNP